MLNFYWSFRQNQINLSPQPKLLTADKGFIENKMVMAILGKVFHESLQRNLKISNIWTPFAEINLRSEGNCFHVFTISRKFSRKLKKFLNSINKVFNFHSSKDENLITLHKICLLPPHILYPRAAPKRTNLNRVKVSTCIFFFYKICFEKLQILRYLRN